MARFAPAACLAKPFALVLLLDTLEQLTSAPVQTVASASHALAEADLAADAALD